MKEKITLFDFNFQKLFLKIKLKKQKPDAGKEKQILNNSEAIL